MHAVVLTFDRLHLGFLGGYGNPWVRTPHLDRLAAGSVVFDRHFGENFDPRAQGHAWWSGCYQFLRSPEPRGRGELGAVLRQAGVRTRLLVEQPVEKRGLAPGSPEQAPEIPAGEGACPLFSTYFPTGVPLPEGFEPVVPVEGRDGLDVPEADVPFARLVVRGADELRELAAGGEGPWLLWLKSRGVPVPWMPPREFARQYLDLVEEDERTDEEEPGDEFDDLDDEVAAVNADQPEQEGVVEFSPEAFDDFLRTLAAPPTEEAPFTETEWRLARQVYAGYVSLLDRQVGRLLEAVRETVGDDCLLIVTAAAGESLGERPASEARRTRLWEEIVHTPLFVRLPDAQRLSEKGDRHPASDENRAQHPGASPLFRTAAEMGSRRQSLVQTVDLPPTLLEWFGIDPARLPCEGQSLLPLVRDEAPAEREFICLGDGGQAVGIQTHDRYLVRSAAVEEADEPQHRLYVKPDDLWEVNEVSAQSPADVESLAERLDRFTAAWSPS